MAINISDFNKIWASTSPLTPYSFSDNNYKQGWNFVGGTPPARQMWDSYMKFSDKKQQYIVNNFLPLSGGTMTGNVGANVNSFRLYSTYENNSGNVVIYGGANGSGNGASLQVHGKSSSGGAGFFNITADNGTDSKLLQGRPNGTLTWDGTSVCVALSSTVVAADAVDFNVTQYAFVARKSNNIMNLGQYISNNATHAQGDLLMTFKTRYRPIGNDIRIPFTGYGNASVYGYVKVATNGECTIDSINDSTTSARICFGGCMWFTA